jgi:hypothetical protein
MDAVISNCVINLTANKATVLAEAARVLRRSRRLAISDVIANAGMDDETKADMVAWTECVAGVLTEEQFRHALTQSGFNDRKITEIPRVYPHASAAFIKGDQEHGVKDAGSGIQDGLDILRTRTQVGTAWVFGLQLSEQGDHGLSVPVGDPGTVANSDEVDVEHGVDPVHGAGRTGTLG